MTKRDIYILLLVLIIGMTIGGSVIGYLVSQVAYEKVTLKQPVTEEQKEEFITIPVYVTVFHPGKKECGKGKLAYTCADGTTIDPNNPMRIAGVSKDLLNIMSYGDSIYINIPEAPYLNNFYTVHTTGKDSVYCKYKGKKILVNNHVDICIANPTVCDIKGSWKGFITLRKPLEYDKSYN